MKLWVDGLHPAPKGYFQINSVNKAKAFIEVHRPPIDPIELIDLDHDSGEFYCNGGDYIRLLNWLEKTGRNYPIRIHSQSPVDVQNMRRIIERNGWKEVF